MIPEWSLTWGPRGWHTVHGGPVTVWYGVHQLELMERSVWWLRVGGIEYTIGFRWRRDG